MDTTVELLDAVGVQLAPGQRVVYATAGMHATGQLVPGTVVSVRHVPDGDWPRERIGIRRDDGQVIYIRWSKRVVVLRQESEANGWLRRSSPCSVRGKRERALPRLLFLGPTCGGGPPREGAALSRGKRGHTGRSALRPTLLTSSTAECDRVWILGHA